jgi:hypothetical protein
MYNRELGQSKRNLKLLLNILACSHETPSFNIPTTTHRGKFPCLRWKRLDHDGWDGFGFRYIVTVLIQLSIVISIMNTAGETVTVLYIAVEF